MSGPTSDPRPRRKVSVIAGLVATTLALLLPGPLGTAPMASSGESGTESFTVDHFQCWAANFPDFEQDNVRLDDETIVSTRASVDRPRLICPPVRKTANPDSSKPTTTQIQNPDHHLVYYDITPNQQDVGGAFLCNQFDCFSLEVSGPIGLLVPTKKGRHDAPRGLDHYQCYTVEGSGHNPSVDVELEDQFHERRTTARWANMVCIPTEKKHGDRTFRIHNRFEWLVCYKTFATELNNPRNRDIRNQFGPDENVKIHTARMLCVPSSPAG